MSIESLIDSYKQEIDSIKSKFNIERKLLSKSKFSGKIAAVDSGIFRVQLGRMLYARIKVRGVLFDYSNSVLKAHNEIRLEPYFDIQIFSNEEDWRKKLNEERIKAEYELLFHIYEVYHPDILLVDGSFIPPYFSNSLLDITSKLLKLPVYAISKNTSSNQLTSKLGLNMGDQWILAYILKNSEYTLPKKDKNPWLDFYFTYIKTTFLPFKVEFKSDVYLLDVLSLIVNSSYKFGYPWIMYEVDRLARIRKTDIIDIKQILKRKFRRILRYDE